MAQKSMCELDMPGSQRRNHSSLSDEKRAEMTGINITKESSRKAISDSSRSGLMGSHVICAGKRNGQFMEEIEKDALLYCAAFDLSRSVKFEREYFCISI
ncbi:hypothetical protein CEXT_395411 [Caerostris extrusa]|uniref:Uncharacterized protein n=1 Tax=Caerostris extrusa TaxID=172846 RepID=A0AAV4XG07_CAEEX|nr:hypothetical protein CEXT_395411 [Caerostris extrusa]